MAANPWTAAASVGAALALSWLASYLANGAAHFPPELFYLPILLGSARFGVIGALLTGVASTVLAGPLMPMDVQAGVRQAPTDWTLRGGLFAAAALLTTALFARVRSGRSDVDQLRHELRAHKAAVIATVSHEFRHPITVIKGVVETLHGRRMVGAEGEPLLKSLKDATERLERLIRTVLAAGGALEKSVPLPQEWLTLSSLMRGVGRGLEQLGGPQRLHVLVAPEVDVIRSNPELLGVLLQSVIENALKFSPPESRVDAWAARAGADIQIRVIDRGPGILPEFLERAFEPFTQQDQSATREHGGLGLGLFAARRIAELLGGRLELGRGPGTGTQVVITLPQRRAEDQRPSAASGDAPQS